MNPFSGVQRRIRYIRRRREFRQVIESASLGKVDFASFQERIAAPSLEVTKGNLLLNPQLRLLLRDDELGSWAFDAATLALLEFLFHKEQPEVILEFGAGVSTLAFASLMKSRGENARPRVYSIEQNDWQIEKTRERLRENGLEDEVKIFHAPLHRQTFFGIENEFYDLDNLTRAAIEAAKPDWIIVDGPAGDDLVRFGTLAQLETMAAPGAT